MSPGHEPMFPGDGSVTYLTRLDFFTAVTLHAMVLNSEWMTALSQQNRNVADVAVMTAKAVIATLNQSETK